MNKRELLTTPFNNMPFKTEKRKYKKVIYPGQTDSVCVFVSGLTVEEVFPIMGFRGVTQAELLSQQGAILR